MKTRILHCASALALTIAAASPAWAQNGSAETQPPNAQDQEPQSPDQTRAPEPSEPAQVEQETVATGLPQLWALEFLPDNSMLVTAKSGAMMIIAADGTPGPEIEGVPEVDAAGQGGLLDVALAPDFETSNRIFFSFSEPRDGGNGTSVASATLVTDDAGGGRPGANAGRSAPG